MPFLQQMPKPFTRSLIEGLRPGQMGVYGLYRPNQWIYVGSGDIGARLLDHITGDIACITAAIPTHWVDEVTTNYINREKDLIVELSPSCNQRVG